MQINMFQEWLSKSGIVEEVQSLFEVGIGQHHILGACIKFPVTDIDGNFLFNKYRKDPTVENNLPKYVYDKGSSVSLYGAHLIKDAKTVLVTEGEKDCLVAWSHNIPAVTSTGGAMSWQDEWAPLLEGKEVIFCFDNDDAGGRGMSRALSKIPGAKILFIPDRPGVKDVSDYVASGGDIHTLMNTARSFTSIEDVKQDKNERVAQWKSTFFHDAYLKDNQKPSIIFKGVKKSSGDNLTAVKEIPIGLVVEFNHDDKRCCLWHNERTGSMKWYKETNTFYCFGCSKHGDVIDVYMQQNNVEFKEAVAQLKKM